ncbi:hypothetical protein I7I48_07970 [Histoplasma ohiense]|nr:hypothetical protein I7I48_07970 [Histoplasma ohiense (nom. inval.)]
MGQNMCPKPQTLRRGHTAVLMSTVLHLQKQKHSFVYLTKVLKLPHAIISSIVYCEDPPTIHLSYPSKIINYLTMLQDNIFITFT